MGCRLPAVSYWLRVRSRESWVVSELEGADLLRLDIGDDRSDMAISAWTRRVAKAASRSAQKTTCRTVMPPLLPWMIGSHRPSSCFANSPPPTSSSGVLLVWCAMNWRMPSMDPRTPHRLNRFRIRMSRACRAIPTVSDPGTLKWRHGSSAGSSDTLRAHHTSASRTINGPPPISGRMSHSRHHASASSSVRPEKVSSSSVAMSHVIAACYQA